MSGKYKTLARGIRAIILRLESRSSNAISSDILPLISTPSLFLPSSIVCDTHVPFHLHRPPLVRHNHATPSPAQDTMEENNNPIAADAPQSSISEGEFHKISDLTLDDLFERIEPLVDNLSLDDTDIEHAQGVLTIKLGDLGTYVINKQTPNRQIWFSSPVSGPVRYDYYKGSWVYRRDGHKMHERLEKELEQLTGVSVDLNPCSTCGKMNACVEGTYCLK